MTPDERDDVKTCTVCQTPFATNGKRVTCSQRCAGFLSRQNAKRINVLTRTERIRCDAPNLANTPKSDGQSGLPPVESLPAAYVKRVHDLWVSLVGDAPTRIA